MQKLIEKRIQKFADEYGFNEQPISEQFERYVASVYLHKYLQGVPELIDKVVLGGGNDEGIDIAAVIINGQIVFEPSEIEELIGDQAASSARVIFIQAKTSERYDAKLISKFLHGVETVTKSAMGSYVDTLAPRLKDIALLIDWVAQNGDRFNEFQIPCEIFYVTTSKSNGSTALQDSQVKSSLRRIRDLGVYKEELRLQLNGAVEISDKQREHHGPQNIKFQFEKRQTIPATEGIDQAFIGIVSGREILKLLQDDSGEFRSGIFEDNVRLDLGAKNPVNCRIAETLRTVNRNQFPFLNNGLTIIAKSLNTVSDTCYASGYQVVNGGQTSHQLVRWASSDQVDKDPSLLDSLWVPVKIVSSADPDVRSRVAVATNLQTAIGASDIQASAQIAKEVEEYFAESGTDGLRYERQARGSAHAIDYPKTRVVGTSELNRAVAATVFGESARAIGSPKELEIEGTFVWGDYPVELFYYAAWIIYKIDRYFARTADCVVLKAAKYHIAMMVSAFVNPKLIDKFQNGNTETQKKELEGKKGRSELQFDVNSGNLDKAIEDAIPKAMSIAAEYFKGVLLEGRSLRKDDVRSRTHQKELIIRVGRKLGAEPAETSLKPGGGGRQ
ncbi:AIPR family protein [Trueperella pecoris]|uniref:AIPR family protein n=1 Tax=Trueperella pecoris TaxID=2733571 RepID=A0A7M1QVN4_9ACTO|nr:AIPR family protein [Trueperella pecoris]QOR46110.1 AIPR family protein [Trueperella pecoris]